MTTPVARLARLLEDGELIIMSRNRPTPMLIACDGKTHTHIEYVDGETVVRTNWSHCPRPQGHTEKNTPAMRERVT